MKKSVITFLLVSAIIGTLMFPVSAGTKKTNSFTLRSYFAEKIETVYLYSDKIVYYDLNVGTDSVGDKHYSGRLTVNSKIFQSGAGLWGLQWRLSDWGYVSGKVDGTKIWLTDK